VGIVVGMLVLGIDVGSTVGTADGEDVGGMDGCDEGT
jgi:hypothetical protein